ncbi:MAG: ABC transporter ATP-binding protein [Planctomycetota bacterium]|jgi:fluoroquinolone transport system ATP-binding protein
MISVKDLHFTYASSTTEAIRGLSFELQDGEIFGFLGPSGAGKSTTQKILIGLLRDYRGKVKVFDRDLQDWGPEYFERIGVSFEFPNHFLKLTALENLRYFAALYSGAKHPPLQLLEQVGLQDDGDLRVSQYSKGMKSRLSVARALLHDPQLLFLDEPTAGLDPMNADRIVRLIRGQQEAGKTVFLTTHDMAVADQLCDRVAFIVDGEIPLIDAPRKLKLEHGKPGVRVEYRDDGQLEKADFPLDGLGENRAFLDLLKGRELQTIHSQEASLADIFIQVTGRGLQ